MSVWLDNQKTKEKNFLKRQREDFEVHAEELQQQIAGAEATYREYPYERTRKYIESRRQELREMEDFMRTRDPDMQRNYEDEIEELCMMLVGMSSCFAAAAPAAYTEFKAMNGKIRRVLQMHGGA